MRLPGFNKVRVRLLGLLGATIAALALVVAGVWEYYIEPALRHGVAKSQREIALHAADLIDNFIDEKITDLRAAAQIGHLWEGVHDHRKALLYQLMKVVPAIRQLSIIDSDGRETVRVSRTRTYTDADLRNFFNDNRWLVPTRGEVYIGPVYHEETAEPFITIGVPIESSTVEIRGALVAEINLKTLWNVVSHIKVGRNGFLYVVSSGGQLIAHADYSRVVAGTNLAAIPEVREFLRDPEIDPGFGDIEPGYSAPRVMTTFALVPKPRWGVVVEESIDTAFEEARQLKILASIILLLAVIAGLLVSFYFSRRITEPIAKLEKGAERVARGDLDYTLDIRTGDEIEQLAEKFNRMALALKHSYRGLESKIADRTRDMSALYAAIAPLKPADSLEQMLSSVLARLREATGADAALFRMWDKERNAYVTPATDGFGDRVAGNVEPPGQLPAVDQVFRTGEPAIIENLGGDARITRKKLLEAGFRSGAFLPLALGSKTIGVAQLVSRTQGFFRQEKEAHLMTIARQMSIALENRDLLEQIQRHLARIRALHEINNAITSTLDLDQVLRVLLEKIEVFVPFAAVATVSLLDRKTGRFEPAVCLNVDEGEWRDAVRENGGQLAKLVSQCQAVVAIDDIQSDPRIQVTEFFEAHNLRAFLGVPLKGSQGILGTLSLFATEQRHFTESEIEFMDTLGGQAAIAIQNSQLFEATRSREAAVRESNRFLTALHSMASAVSQSLDPDRVLRAAIENITELFRFDATRVHLYDEAAGELTVRAAFENNHARFAKARSFKCGQGIIGRVAESGEPLIFANIQTDARYRELSQTKVSGQFGYLFLAVFPIRSKQRSFGTLTCVSTDARQLADNERQLLEAMTDQIAVAMENSRLYEEVKKKVEEVEQQAARLAMANKVKDEFLSVISHELRTPLSVISGYASLLADETFGNNSPEQAKGLRVIKERAEGLSELVRTVLEAARLASGTAAVTLESVDPGALLSMIKDRYLFHEKRDAVDLIWEVSPTLPRITTDGDKVHQILVNLIDNALKFTDRGRVTVSARAIAQSAERMAQSAEHGDGPENPQSEIRNPQSEGRPATRNPKPETYMEFSVADTGIGITSEAIPLIFEKFRQGDSGENRAYEGAGLGLYIVKKFTELLGGEVSVESRPGHGSTFRVVLPCRCAPAYGCGPRDGANLAGAASPQGAGGTRIRNTRDAQRRTNTIDDIA
jgi:signal transduction histidine kinase